MAIWLNTWFYPLDKAVFVAMSKINCGFLNFFCKFFSLFGEKGIPLILASLVLMCFAKTRKMGFCMLFAIAVGALFTNIILKEAVARPRPFTKDEFNPMWISAGSVEEGEFSFPSGHTTATTAFVFALFLSWENKWSFCALPFALLMGFCRVYLIVHYTTDVIAGMIVGITAGLISFYATKYLFALIEKYKDKKLFKFALEFDVMNFLKKGNTNQEKVSNEQENKD